MNFRKLTGKKILYPIIATACAILAYSVSAFRRMEVDTALVEKGTVREVIFEEETRTRLDRLRTISAPITGKSARIEFEVGDCIEAGELVTTIEDDEILNAIKGAEAKVREIEARIGGLPAEIPKDAELKAGEEAVKLSEEMKEGVKVERKKAGLELAHIKKQYERIAKLREQNVASQEAYDHAGHKYELAKQSVLLAEQNLIMAEMEVRIFQLHQEALEESLGDIEHLEKAYTAQIEQIRAELETLRYQAGKTQILSPISGIIVEKHIDSRKTVQAGRPLVDVGCLDSIEIKSDVLSSDIFRVEPGQEVILEGGILGDRLIPGTVLRIYPHGFTKISALGIEQQRFRVVIGFDREKANLPPGADLDARIIVAEKDNMLYVTPAAIFTTPEGPAVFKISGGRARLTHVSTGIYGEDRIEIISGLERGDVVIIRPPAELEPDSRVNIKN